MIGPTEKRPNGTVRRAAFKATLLQLQKITGTKFFVVPEAALNDPRVTTAKMHTVYDPVNKVWCFGVEPLQKPLIQAPRRIVLPGGKVG